jgi:hypothetical protein
MAAAQTSDWPEFVGSVVSRRRDQGVDVISIKGRLRTDDGTVMHFSVSGSDPKSVIEQFSKLGTL